MNLNDAHEAHGPRIRAHQAPAAVRLQHHGELKMAARRRGEDIIDFGMGNPDGADAARTSSTSWSRPRSAPTRTATRCRRAFRGCAARSATGTSAATASTSIRTREAIVTIGSKEGIAHLMLATLGPRRHGAGAEPELSDPHLRRRSSPAPTSARCRMTPDVRFLRRARARDPASSSRSRRC